MPPLRGLNAKGANAGPGSSNEDCGGFQKQGRRRSTMFLGLRTAIYHVGDIDRGKAWYTEVLGLKPYFDQPFYVGFNVSGYELGLQPSEGSSATKADGAVAYWGVENAQAAFKQLIDLGAISHEPVQDVGQGIRVGAVKDPFGNVFGIIENPNFKAQ